MSFPCVSSTYLPRTCPVLMLLSHALQRSNCLILLFLWRLLLRSSLALSLCGFCFFDVNLGLNLSLVLEGFLCKFCCTFAAKAFRCSARFLDTASCSQDSHRFLFAMHCFLSSPENEWIASCLECTPFLSENNLVETPCFLGFVLHNLSSVCLLNLVVLGLSLKNHHNILLCRGGYSRDEWRGQTWSP